MKLGPLQTKWVEALEAHPNRQTAGHLGHVDGNGDIRACCLGQALLCLYGYAAIQSGLIRSGTIHGTLNPIDRDILGLYTHSGSIRQGEYISYNDREFRTLAQANDGGVPWSFIAKFIRENPESVFYKSV